MELNNLKPAAGSIKKEKRIGRGQGSGHGGTSTRGHKGAKSRSGVLFEKKFSGEDRCLCKRACAKVWLQEHQPWLNIRLLILACITAIS